MEGQVLGHARRGFTFTWVLATFVAVAAAMLLAFAPHSKADVPIAISAPDATVGVTTTITASVPAGTPDGQLAILVDSKEVTSGNVGGSGALTVSAPWTPEAVGQVPIEARYSPSEGSETEHAGVFVTVRMVRTHVILDSPLTAVAGETVYLSATVRAEEGSYIPTGHVTFGGPYGGHYASGLLDLTGHVTALLTAPSPGSKLNIVAFYEGDTNAKSSHSKDRPLEIRAPATTSSTSVRIQMDTVFNVGESIPVTATVSPYVVNGSVTFSINGADPGTVKPIDHSAARTSVKFSHPGTYRFTAHYSGDGKHEPATNTVMLRVGLVGNPDTISLVRDGDPTPWVRGSVTTLTNGTDAVLIATSESHSPVTLHVTGPCSLNGSTLHVDGVGDVCQLTARSPGGNGFDPVTYLYSVATAAGGQTATVNPPRDRAVEVKHRIKLAPMDAVTNLGQPVVWYADQSAGVCRIVRDKGWYWASMLRQGRCVVTGVAPAISNQWSEFRVTRLYTVVAASK